MSIEVSNESGIDVSEEELISIARFVIRKMKVNPAAELSMVLLDTAGGQLIGSPEIVDLDADEAGRVAGSLLRRYGEARAVIRLQRRQATEAA